MSCIYPVMRCVADAFHDRSAKAVADGALSFYLDQYVALRIAKISYGTKYHWKYEPNNSEHKKRLKSVWTRPSGEKLVKGGFRTVLKKVKFGQI